MSVRQVLYLSGIAELKDELYFPTFCKITITSGILLGIIVTYSQ